MKKKKLGILVLSFFIFLFIFNISLVNANRYWNYLTIGQADGRYCKMYGNCVVNNLTVIDTVSNVTVQNINVTDDVEINGNLTFPNENQGINFLDLGSISYRNSGGEQGIRYHTYGNDEGHLFWGGDVKIRKPDGASWGITLDNTGTANFGSSLQIGSKLTFENQGSYVRVGEGWDEVRYQPQRRVRTTKPYYMDENLSVETNITAKEKLIVGTPVTYPNVWNALFYGDNDWDYVVIQSETGVAGLSLWRDNGEKAIFGVTKGGGYMLAGDTANEFIIDARSEDMVLATKDIPAVRIDYNTQDVEIEDGNLRIQNGTALQSWSIENNLFGNIFRTDEYDDVVFGDTQGYIDNVIWYANGIRMLDMLSNGFKFRQPIYGNPILDITSSAEITGDLNVTNKVQIGNPSNTAKDLGVEGETFLGDRTYFSSTNRYIDGGADGNNMWYRGDDDHVFYADGFNEVLRLNLSTSEMQSSFRTKKNVTAEKGMTTWNMTVHDTLSIDYQPATTDIDPSIKIGEMTNKNGYASSLHMVGGLAIQRRSNALNTYLMSIWDANDVTLLGSMLIGNEAGGNSYQQHCYSSNCLLRYYATGSSHREHMRLSEDDFIIFDDDTNAYPLWIEKDEHQNGYGKASPIVAHDFAGGVAMDSDLNVSNHLDVDGNITGTIYYAQGWGQHAGEVQINASDVYFNFTSFNETIMNGFDIVDGALTIIDSGMYKVDGTWSFSGTPNNEYHIAVAVNNEVKPECHAQRVIGSGGDVGDAGTTCLLRLSAGDYLNTQIENEDSTGNPDIHDINFNIIWIGK
jgi:cytoskeletal protein CcmA (bactofilin family)